MIIFSEKSIAEDVSPIFNNKINSIITFLIRQVDRQENVSLLVTVVTE